MCEKQWQQEFRDVKKLRQRGWVSIFGKFSSARDVAKQGASAYNMGNRWGCECQLIPYLRPLLLLMLLAATAGEAGTLTDYIGAKWKTLREKLAVPAMRYFYYPDRMEIPLSPLSHSLKIQEILFRTADGVRLHGRFYQSVTRPRGTIVQFHGNAGNLSNHVDALLWLVENGYNLFVFDYRGYGRSESKPSPSGLYQDALAALREMEHLHRTYAADGLLVIVGQSLGGAVVLKALEDFKATLPVDLLVLDSTFASYRNVALRITGASFPGVLLTPLAWLLVSDAYAADPQRYTHRLLVLHSRGDQTVPFSCGQRIYEQAASRDKDFWTDDATAHVLLTPDRPDIQKRFLQLLSELEKI